MRNNISGESLVGIIIGVTILSISILGILNLLLFSYNLTEIFNNNTRLNILKDNAVNVVKKLDTSEVLENEVFYLYKNKITKQFSIHTGSSNAGIKYIDGVGDIVNDLEGFEDYIYARLMWLQREDTSIADNQNQIIKASIRRLIKK